MSSNRKSIHGKATYPRLESDIEIHYEKTTHVDMTEIPEDSHEDSDNIYQSSVQNKTYETPVPLEITTEVTSPKRSRHLSGASSKPDRRNSSRSRSRDSHDEIIVESSSEFKIKNERSCHKERESRHRHSSRKCINDNNKEKRCRSGSSRACEKNRSRSRHGSRKYSQEKSESRSRSRHSSGRRSETKSRSRSRHSSRNHMESQHEPRSRHNSGINHEKRNKSRSRHGSGRLKDINDEFRKSKRRSKYKEDDLLHTTDFSSFKYPHNYLNKYPLPPKSPTFSFRSTIDLLPSSRERHGLRQLVSFLGYLKSSYDLF